MFFATFRKLDKFWIFFFARKTSYNFIFLNESISRIDNRLPNKSLDKVLGYSENSSSS